LLLGEQCKEGKGFKKFIHVEREGEREREGGRERER
jgi:hypothetical protein